MDEEHKAGANSANAKENEEKPKDKVSAKIKTKPKVNSKDKPLEQKNVEKVELQQKKNVKDGKIEKETKQPPKKDTEVVDGQTTSVVSAKSADTEKLLAKSQEDKNKNEDIPQLEILIDHGVTELRENVGSPLPGGGTLDLRRIKDFNSRVVNSFRDFFVEEWKAFMSERQTTFYEKELFSTNLDFDAIREEWRYRPDNPAHWENQKKKIKEDDTFPPLFYSIVIGFIFTCVPNGAIVLDISAGYEYIFGTYYIKRIYDNATQLDSTCRNITGFGLTNGKHECFEKDPVWGTLSLVLLFLPGIFWSLGIFIQWATYLRRKSPKVYDNKRRFFFFFIPLAAVCLVTFPFQLMTISLISCFNNQDHWMTLTSKVGIAEGFFNAHFQFLLQLFVFFVRADRFPSFFQYAACFGSLLFLVWSRIESLLLDRGGHRLSPGQKAWWVCRFGPMFLFNSAFKLGSISLILAMLRYNAIWLYAGIILIWLLLQFLFNENILPRRFYYLFIGAGLHAVSVAHIQEEVKMIKTHPDSKKNILWVTRLTSIQLKANMWFQNIMWFFFNSLIIITITIFAEYNKETEVPSFWPFSGPEDTYNFTNNKVFGGLNIITPTIVVLGVFSLALLLLKEFDSAERCLVTNPINLGKVGDHPDCGKGHPKDHSEGVSSKRQSKESIRSGSSTASTRSQSPEKGAVFSAFPGFKHVLKDCPGCLDEQMEPDEPQYHQPWHLYESDNEAEHGLVGALSRIIAPLMNVWQSAVDKHLV